MRGHNNVMAEVGAGLTGAPILVVDAAAVDLKFTRLLLTYEGYSVRTASLAEEALDMIGKFRPELVLTDMRLPGMDGLELARRIKQDPRTRSIKVIALTAHTGAVDERKAIGAGCDAYLTKPIDSGLLSARVRQMLQRALPAPEPALPEEKPSHVLADPELDRLRRVFLYEGTEQARQLLETLDSRFDSAEAGRLLHSWVGTGGFIGCPGISKLARAAEDILRAGDSRSRDLRDALSALHWEFSSLLAEYEVSIPAHVARTLHGKAVALIGFPPPRASFLCSTFGGVHARPRLFDASESPGAPAVAACELVIVHAGADTRSSSWLDPEALPPSAAVMYVGRDLLSLPPALLTRASDLLGDTWQPEEVLLKACLALSRRAAPVSDQPAAPVHVPARVHAPAHPPAPSASTRPNVLIADDDALILTMVGSTIENYGMQCRRATNGEDALRLIRETRPQVAVLDINMPGMDGYEVLAAIRAENLPVLVVLLTARQREGDILRGFQLGADDYLVKPFNPLELVARIKRLVRR